MGRAEAASAVPGPVDSAKEPTSRGNFQAAGGNPNRHARDCTGDGDAPSDARGWSACDSARRMRGTNSRCRMDRDAPPDTLG
jgi:hypothetical protein